MALIDNLVSYWQFEETTFDYIDVVGGNDFVSGTAPTRATGKINYGQDFESGSSEFIYTDSSADFKQAVFTLNFWFKPENIDDFQMLFRVDDLVGNLLDFYGTYVYMASAKINFYAFNGGNTSSYDRWLTDNAITAGNWFMITIVYGGNDDGEIYVNGSADASQLSSGGGAIAYNTDAFFVLGDRYYDGSWAGNYPDGIIDEIGFWSRKLSGDEITALYNSGNGLAYPFSTGTNFQLNIGDDWKVVEGLQINIGDVWKDVEGVQINIGDDWKTIL